MSSDLNLALCCSDSIVPFILIVVSIVDYEHISEASLIDN